jgi:hypothetical protein
MGPVVTPDVGEQPFVRRRLVDLGAAGNMCRMDERASHFLVIVGRLCADARIGELTVCLTLANGDEVAGVPQPPRDTEGPEEVDATGYADSVSVDGVAVALSDVVEASVSHPRRG